MLRIDQILVQVYKYFRARRYLLFLLLGLWAVGSFVALRNLHFKEDINSVFPDDPEVQRANEILKHSPFLNRIYVIVKLKNSSSNPELLSSVADEFENGLKSKDESYFSNIQNKVNDETVLSLIDLVRQNIPIYLNDSDYAYINAIIHPDSVRNIFESGYRQILSPAGFAFKSNFVKDPLGITWLGMAKLKKLNINKNFTINNGHLISSDGKNLLIFIDPASESGETGRNKKMVAIIDDVIKETTMKYTDAEIMYFGAPAVSVANATQIQKDIWLTVGLAFILLNFLVLYHFRKWYTMPLLFTPVIFGTITGLAVVTLINGSISLIALGIGSVMLELILDFSIHAYTHYHEKRDPEIMIKSISSLLLATAFTTSLSFLCLLGLKSNLLNDLGLFAAVNISSASLFTVLVFPHFLKQTNKKVASTKFRTNIFNIKFPRIIDRSIGFVVMILSIISLFYMNRVGFDANMDNFSYVPLHLKQAENYLDTVSDFKLKNVYLISEGKTFDEALQKNAGYSQRLDSMKNAGVIDGYLSVNSLWPEPILRDEKLSKWKMFWTQERINALKLMVGNEVTHFHFKKDVFNEFFIWLENPLLFGSERAVTELKNQSFKDLIQQTENGYKIITLIRIKEDNKPIFYSQFNQSDFVFDNKFVFNKLLQVLQEDFQYLSWLSSILVFVVVLITFRRFELSLGTMIPMMLGWFMTLGMMYFMGVKLNIFNLIICTFIFGLGIDYSIFYGRGILDSYRQNNKEQSSFRISILLSVITTILGMGVLIFAKHPALKSIGSVSVLGLFSVAVITFYLQPFIFRFILYYRKKPRKMLLTLVNILVTIGYFGFYVLNSIFMFIMAILLVKLPIVPKGKLILEKLNSIMARITLGMAFVAKRNFKEVNMKVFDEPSIIIANHQSSLDIVVSAMLSGKIRIVTKDWVFKIPIIGFMARVFEFYKVEECNEPAFVEKAKADLANGYSIMFFPEGTRSKDLAIHRFRKGAFLLAEQTGAEIQPLLIHGTGISMPSGSIMLGPGLLQLKLLPRIKLSDKHFPSDYSSRTKAINKYMRREFAEFRDVIEDDRFIRIAMKPRFVYRSPEVRQTYKSMLQDLGVMKALHHELAGMDRIVMINDLHAAQSSYLLFKSADRNLTLITDDENTLFEIDFVRNWHSNLLSSTLHEFNESFDAMVITGGNELVRYAETLTSFSSCKKIIVVNPSSDHFELPGFKVIQQKGLIILARDEKV